MTRRDGVRLDLRGGWPGAGAGLPQHRWRSHVVAKAFVELADGYIEAAGGHATERQRYLVYRTAADPGGRRSPLTIAVARPGERLFRHIFRIRNAAHPMDQSHPEARLSFSCAIEHEGYLYVAYSNSGVRLRNVISAPRVVIPSVALNA